MKIGDKVVIDKEYYVQKHKEIYPEWECDGLTNDKELLGYKQFIIDGRELLVVNISAMNYRLDSWSHDKYVIYIHFLSDDGIKFMTQYDFIKDDSKEIPNITSISDLNIEPRKNTNIENIIKLLKEKKSTRKSTEDRIINDIRSNKDIYKPDLEAIFALSVTITALEELLILEEQNH
jgi:hypothetical protein